VEWFPDKEIEMSDDLSEGSAEIAGFFFASIFVRLGVQNPTYDDPELVHGEL